MRTVGEAAENCPSDSDEDFYTKSVDLRNVMGRKLKTKETKDYNCLPDAPSTSNIMQKEFTLERGAVTHVDDDSDSLNLSETEDTFLTKSKEARLKRLKRIEREKSLDLEEIMSNPHVIMVLPNQKKSKRGRADVVLDSPAPLRRKTNFTNKDSREMDVIELRDEVDLRRNPDVVLDSPEVLRRKTNSSNRDSREVEVIEIEKEVNLRGRADVVSDSPAPLRKKTNSTNRDSREKDVIVIELEKEVNLRGRADVVSDSSAPLRRKTNSTNRDSREKDVIELGKEVNLRGRPSVVLDRLTPLTKTYSLNRDSRETDVVELEKEVNLFVTVRMDQKTGKPGRFMTIRQDEPFDSLRRGFAEELNCNQIDVLIHVNNVDAGPGDTPNSMRLDINKLAVVNVFCLKAKPDQMEDFSTNPNFIPVKCIFAVGRPRRAFISLMESMYDAKQRIREQLKLSRAINKLIFDNEVANDEETPQSVGIEAEDVIEIHLVS